MTVATIAAEAPAARERQRGEYFSRLVGRPLLSYYLLLGTTAVLLAIGLVMVLSASSVVAYQSTGSSYSIFLKQVLWVSVGVPVLAVASRLRPQVFRWLGYPALIVSVGLLTAVLVPGIGVSVNGATRWVAIGPFALQPSEFAKVAIVLWGADLLARKVRLLSEWKHLLVPLLPVAAMFGALVMLQPDMGTTMVLLLVVVALLFVAGAPMRLFVGLISVLAAFGAVLAVVEPYRLARLTSFTDPFKDPQVTGYQAVHGIYALASGGWWGLGLGASREKWPKLLPNAHTDFILAILGEELGLAGALALLVLFGLLGYVGIRIAARNRDPFVRFAAAGCVAWLLGQALINMGAVVGLLPITGIPLPLISFGGSSLVPTLFAIGMLLAFARAEPGAAEALAARGPSPLRRLVAHVWHPPVRRPARARPAIRRSRVGRARRRAAP